ncbi:AlbA family DNA-binding domain-containing protein [Baekduia sp. Peel2402]|uniref:AlbA family DNA-binding domain-containing protein n=1 Tax=Baekduia sp. Peel2402 TaxID=3458296 RepID=UPI00403E462B
MSASELRYDPEAVALFIGAEQVVDIARDDAVVASVEAVSKASVTSMERALGEYEEADGATVSAVYLSDVPANEFDGDQSPRDLPLSFIGGRLMAEIGRGLDREDGLPFDVAGLLAPLLERYGGSYGDSFRDEQEGHWFELHSLALAGDERTMGELFEMATNAQALLDAASGNGALTARTVRDLLAGGHAQALVGQPESSWIDAKAIPHKLDGEGASFELGKDVAAFANLGQDAIIVFGLVTEPGASGGDVIDRVHPFKLSSVNVPALANALADRLVPLLTDLDIGLVESRAGSGYGYGWLFIPQQPPHVRPVLVRGALAGDKVLGAHISIPWRVGEDTRHWDASTVHALIQAGRVALEQAEQREADRARPPDGR